MRGNPKDHTVYSFRAECQHDFDTLVRFIITMGEELSIREVRPGLLDTTQGPMPVDEPLVEISTTLSLDRLREILRQIPDSHVLLQTLRPISLEQNKCDRDYSLN